MPQSTRHAFTRTFARFKNEPFSRGVRCIIIELSTTNADKLWITGRKFARIACLAEIEQIATALRWGIRYPQQDRLSFGLAVVKDATQPVPEQGDG